MWLVRSQTLVGNFRVFISLARVVAKWVFWRSLSNQKGWIGTKHNPQDPATPFHPFWTLRTRLNHHFLGTRHVTQFWACTATKTGTLSQRSICEMVAPRAPDNFYAVSAPNLSYMSLCEPPRTRKTRFTEPTMNLLLIYWANNDSILPYKEHGGHSGKTFFLGQKKGRYRPFGVWKNRPKKGRYFGG